MVADSLPQTPFWGVCPPLSLLAQPLHVTPTPGWHGCHLSQLAVLSALSVYATSQLVTRGPLEIIILAVAIGTQRQFGRPTPQMAIC